ncbi:hypothetical protein Y032_0045g1196 [Ancylostoma ceylanicum]|uniref:Uncharacterized protein n=1 Tax=Ancylostoma ceylanicum TaxID=53326 RepID=A0A016UEF3_9BILA|nr:hypothetical protein Y032_0045g1196 [Ancylostoma ceylanicum]
MLASCAVAAASGFLIYYYCDNEQESVSVVDAGRDYGMRSSAGAQSDAAVQQSGCALPIRMRATGATDVTLSQSPPLSYKPQCIHHLILIVYLW